MKLVPRVVFGAGIFDSLPNLINELYGSHKGYVLYLVDSIHKSTGLLNRVNHSDGDLLIEVDVSKSEPETQYIDSIRDRILMNKNNELPKLIVGIGGGSTMDIAKAISVILVNTGSSADYQGWDLVKQEAVPKIGIPTISGTGSEATRTAVLTSPQKKMGINSDQSIFNVILLDPDLIKTVDKEQEFFTGMDCYIHCVESLSGSFINDFGRAFAITAKEKSANFFLKDKNYADLMVASYLGGNSIAFSEVGICHAMSYGLSLVLKFRHGIANCLIFNQLHDYYGKDVELFWEMMKKNNISLPVGITKNISNEMMDKMVEMTLRMEKPLTNALGENWRDILTRDKIVDLYNKI